MNSERVDYPVDDIFRVIKSSSESRLIVRGSRFFALCAPAADEPGALDILETRRKYYHDATHHCWAFRVGDPGSPLERFSDDGEPSGTAGMPILEQLRKTELVGAILVVTRWFGGTKLGRGGLARAYGQCASDAMMGLKLHNRVPEERVSLRCDYSLIGLIENSTSKYGGSVVRGDYGAEAVLTVELPKRSVTPFLNYLLEKSAGRIEVLRK